MALALTPIVLAVIDPGVARIYSFVSYSDGTSVACGFLTWQLSTTVSKS